MSSIYTFDTNVVIRLFRELPRDVYASVWDRVEHLISDGRAHICRDACDESERIDDECAPWAKGLNGFVIEPNSDEVAKVADITRRHPDWVQETMNAADPWVVASAAVHGFVIVTQERLKGRGTTDRNLKIPNVALEESVTCLNFTDLARAEGWQF